MSKAVIRFSPILGVLLALAGPARTVDEQQIKNATAAAVSFLKAIEWDLPAETAIPRNDIGHDSNTMEGPMALAGIALMEAGVNPTDPAIQKIAVIVRRQAVIQSRTYQLALDIVFLDKLGEPADTPVIQSMGVRLLCGQSQPGRMGLQLSRAKRSRKSPSPCRVGRRDNEGAKTDGNDRIGPGERAALDADLRETLKRPRQAARNGGLGGQELLDDNSNTQFAVIGIWAARRHGVPVDESLKILERRLRTLQTANSGLGLYRRRHWSLHAHGVHDLAGLLGIAIVTGNKGERSMKAATINPDGTIKVGSAAAEKKPLNPMADPSVRKGFEFLAAVMSGEQGGPPGGAGGAMPPGSGGGRPGGGRLAARYDARNGQRRRTCRVRATITTSSGPWNVSALFMANTKSATKIGLHGEPKRSSPPKPKTAHGRAGNTVRFRTRVLR